MCVNVFIKVTTQQHHQLSKQQTETIKTDEKHSIIPKMKKANSTPGKVVRLLCCYSCCACHLVTGATFYFVLFIVLSRIVINLCCKKNEEEINARFEASVLNEFQNYFFHRLIYSSGTSFQNQQAHTHSKLFMEFQEFGYQKKYQNIRVFGISIAEM